MLFFKFFLENDCKNENVGKNKKGSAEWFITVRQKFRFEKKRQTKLAPATWIGVVGLLLRNIVVYLDCVASFPPIMSVLREFCGKRGITSCYTNTNISTTPCGHNY